MTPWVKCVSTLWGHGSNSRVHFMGYSLFYVWVTVWVRRLTHILTHTVSGEKVRKNPEIIRFQGFSGAAGRIRTADLILTKDALYLLSYSSIKMATRNGLEPSTSSVTG